MNPKSSKNISKQLVSANNLASSCCLNPCYKNMGLRQNWFLYSLVPFKDHVILVCPSNGYTFAQSHTTSVILPQNLKLFIFFASYPIMSFRTRSCMWWAEILPSTPPPCTSSKIFNPNGQNLPIGFLTWQNVIKVRGPQAEKINLNYPGEPNLIAQILTSREPFPAVVKE